MRVPSLLVLSTVALLSGGCATIVGIGDYENGPAEEDTSTGDVAAEVLDAPVDSLSESTPDAQLDSDIIADSVASNDSGVSDAFDSGDDTNINDASSQDSSSADSSVIDASDSSIDSGPPDTGSCGALNTISNCGACGNACNTSTSTGPTCSGTSCGYSGCSAGWADCNTTAPDLDGCETATTTITNCGGCGNRCDTTNSNGASCSAGVICTYTSCKFGFADCNSAAPDTDGCESNLSSLTSCGACGVVCDTTHTNGVTCSSGKCAHTSCATGWSDCNAGAPGNTADADGCECNTPVCCGTGCGVGHKNCVGSGCSPLGQTYFDVVNACQVVGTPGNATTYNTDMAFAARAAAPTTAGDSDSTGTCTDQTTGQTNQIAIRQTATACYVWQYTGTLAGYVYINSANNTCACPNTGSPTWN